MAFGCVDQMAVGWRLLKEQKAPYMGKVVVVVRWPLVALTRWPLAGGCLKSKKAPYMGKVVVVVKWPLVVLTRWPFARGYLRAKGSVHRESGRVDQMAVC